MRKLLLSLSLSLAAAAVCAGCVSQLDSGYEPRRLGASDAQRRAYYSSPYSEETQQALQEDHYGGETQRMKY